MSDCPEISNFLGAREQCTQLDLICVKTKMLTTNTLFLSVKHQTCIYNIWCDTFVWKNVNLSVFMICNAFSFLFLFPATDLFSQNRFSMTNSRNKRKIFYNNIIIYIM